MDQIPVEDKTVVAVKTSRKKALRNLRHSNYFLTINTQQRYTGHEEDYEEFVEKFREVIDHIFSRENLPNILVLTDVAKEKGHTLTPQYVKQIKIEKAIERGGKNDTVHVHILFKVAHYTNLSLKYSDIKQAVQDQMELPSVYMQSKLYKNAEDTLENYLMKNA